jgi:hypothetical protein
MAVSTLAYWEQYPPPATGGGGATAPANPNKSVQWNNGGVFGGDAKFLWDSGTSTVQFGQAVRITADTSDAAQNNRFWFYNSVVNGNTNFGLMPNGTGATALLRTINKSDPTVALSLGQFGQVGTITVIDATVLNGGTQGTIEARIASVMAWNIDVSKNFALAAGFQRPVVSKTANYTAVETDSIIFCDASGGSFTITLPAANIAGAGFSMSLRIKRIDTTVANTVTVARAGGDTIDGGTSFVMGPLQACDLENDGSSKWGVV